MFLSVVVAVTVTDDTVSVVVVFDVDNRLLWCLVLTELARAVY